MISKISNHKIIGQLCLAFTFVLIFGGIWYLASHLDYDWQWSKFPYYLYPKYVLSTLKLAFLSCIVGILIGIPFGLGRASKNPLFYWISVIYIEVIRRVPLIVQILFFYPFFTLFFGLERFCSGVLILSIYVSFQAGYIVFSGIRIFNSYENAKLMGKRKLIISVSIQFLFLFILLIKDSALLSLIAVPELYSQTRHIISSHKMAFEGLFFVSGIYIFLTWTISRVIMYIQKKHKKNDIFLTDPKYHLNW